MKKLPKPPLGLEPRCLVDEERSIEILEACLRYTHRGKRIPSIWLQELQEISRRVRISFVPSERER